MIFDNNHGPAFEDMKWGQFDLRLIDTNDEGRTIWGFLYDVEEVQKFCDWENSPLPKTMPYGLMQTVKKTVTDRIMGVVYQDEKTGEFEIRQYFSGDSNRYVIRPVAPQKAPEPAIAPGG